MSGTLYIVATPIGNLGDISDRACKVLGAVDVIAAEDTRHSRPLLDHFGIDTRMLAYHDHNEERQAGVILERLQQGESVALISDAGTPLINDPGYHLVRQARQAGIDVVPVPGPSATIAALSAAGLPTDRFVFEGFLPAKQKARQSGLQAFLHETRTVVVLESCHRIEAMLADIVEILGPEREIVVARELTKTFEQFHMGRADAVLEWLREDANHQKGEFVVMIAGAPAPGERSGQVEAEQVLRVLLAELPLKQAAALAAKITGQKKNALYQQALEITQNN